MTKNDISNFLTESCILLKRKFSVEKIGLFGSYAKGTATEERDIDIIVDMPSGFDLYYDLKEFLEKTFQKEVDFGLSRSMRKLYEIKGLSWIRKYTMNSQ